MSVGGADIARARRLLDDGALSDLLGSLAVDGHHARIVGGAVRNTLLGRAVSDIDICTTRLPPDVIRVAAVRGWNAIPTGIDHGTVTIIITGRAFEVTTLREDVATDGRHAVVRFGTSFEDDAARRDFTINAMSLGMDGVLHDYFDGLLDLAAQRVRFIGDADQRLREDYLRGLRFLRFSAEYGDGHLDAAGLAAVARRREGMAGLSAERIRQEFMKLLLAPHAVSILAEAVRHDLIQPILDADFDIQRFADLRSRGTNVGVMPLLYALCRGRRADWQDLRARLRLSNAESALLAAFETGDVMIGDGAGPLLLAYRLPEALPGLAALHPDTFGRNPSEIDARLAQLKADPPIFLPSGSDLLARGLAPGPLIGRILTEAERLWIAAGFPPEREVQDRLLEDAIRCLSG